MEYILTGFLSYFVLMSPPRLQMMHPKFQLRPTLISVLLLNVLNSVGNVDCYNGWSHHASQPKETFKFGFHP